MLFNPRASNQKMSLKLLEGSDIRSYKMDQNKKGSLESLVMRRY